MNPGVHHALTWWKPRFTSFNAGLTFACSLMTWGGYYWSFGKKEFKNYPERTVVIPPGPGRTRDRVAVSDTATRSAARQVS